MNNKIEGIDLIVEAESLDQAIREIGSSFEVSDYSKIQAFEGGDPLLLISLAVSSTANLVAIIDFILTLRKDSKKTQGKTLRINRANEVIEIDLEAIDVKKRFDIEQ